jgi:hypothetical protein
VPAFLLGVKSLNNASVRVLTVIVGCDFDNLRLLTRDS